MLKRDVVERDPGEQASHTELLEGQNRVLEAIVQGAALQDTLDSLVRLIETQAPGMLASILLLDADGVHLRHGSAPSLPDSFIHAIDGAPIGPHAGSCGTAAFEHEPVVVEDVTADPRWEGYRDVAVSHGLRACWSTPIFDAHRRVLGTFAMYFRAAGVPTAWHRRLIDISTHIAAIAIVKHRETETLRRREAQFAEAQRIAQLGSYEWDPRTGAVLRSTELCRIFGLGPGEFPPTLEGYLSRVHPEDRDNTRRIIEQALRDAAPFSFEERIIRPDGCVRRLRSQGSWMLDEFGRPARLVGICQDITERTLAEDRLRRSEREISERRKVAESLTTRNEELNAFAYTVSHDLRAPLRAIAGYARELDTGHRERLNERTIWCVGRILEATHDLERLIEELLQYSRLDTQVPTDCEVMLEETVEAILEVRRRAILEQGAEVVVEMAGASLRTWERGLAQVLTNLIDNALKYTRKSTPPRIRISSEAVPHAIRIAVADNGIGFDMKHHDRLFGLFTRLVSQEEFDGTGAGLAIAKKLTEKMGGRIWAESTSGAGATFFVELPRVPPHASSGAGGR